MSSLYEHSPECCRRDGKKTRNYPNGGGTGMGKIVKTRIRTRRGLIPSPILVRNYIIIIIVIVIIIIIIIICNFIFIKFLKI